VINDDKKTLEIQKALKKENYLVGAIRKPTVDKSIIRIIIKQDVSNQLLKKFCDKLKSIIEF
jgi:8-amino-7-oxononanoate synthase